MRDPELILMCICMMYVGRQTDQPPPSLVDILTGICWDKEDADKIKRLIIESMVELEFERDPESMAEILFGKEKPDDAP